MRPRMALGGRRGRLQPASGSGRMRGALYPRGPAWPARGSPPTGIEQPDVFLGARAGPRGVDLGQQELEGGAYPNLASDVDLAARACHEGMDEREPEPRPARAALGG